MVGTRLKTGASGPGGYVGVTRVGVGALGRADRVVGGRVVGGRVVGRGEAGRLDLAGEEGNPVGAAVVAGQGLVGVRGSSGAVRGVLTAPQPAANARHSALAMHALTGRGAFLVPAAPKTHLRAWPLTVTAGAGSWTGSLVPA